MEYLPFLLLSSEYSTQYYSLKRRQVLGDMYAIQRNNNNNNNNPADVTRESRQQRLRRQQPNETLMTPDTVKAARFSSTPTPSLLSLSPSPSRERETACSLNDNDECAPRYHLSYGNWNITSTTAEQKWTVWWTSCHTTKLHLPTVTSDSSNKALQSHSNTD